VQERGHLLPFPQAPDGLELRHLRAFVAVAEELNFGRAAERLYISQPALSRQIRALEQIVGCELFRRSTHRVELTVAGEALLDRARKLLGDVDEAVSATLAVGGELVSRIAGLLEPLESVATTDPGLQDARAALETLNAEFSLPPNTQVRPVRANGVPSLIVAPDDAPEPSLLYLHGGAYVLGSAFGYQPHAGALATASQAAVLVPDYRLAPEDPFPAALEDALAAYSWLLERETPPERLTVAGDSSGGGLVMSLLISLRDRGLPLPGGAVVFCPWVDLALRLQDAQLPASGLASLEEARRCAAAYLAGHPIDDPVVDALNADLSGLPPLLIQAATGDAHLADAKALAAHARDQGVEVKLELFPVDAHAFQLFWSFLPEAADAMQSAGDFARSTRRAAHAGAAG
jgi:epsilon-lactone hydrolase